MATGNGPAWFVDPVRGSDANDGGEKSPWKTINGTLDRLKPGDTLVLRGGTYFENVYCAVAGTAEKSITIRSYPGEQVILDGAIPLDGKQLQVGIHGRITAGDLRQPE